MISLLPLTKMFSLFAVLSLLIVTAISYLLSLCSVDTYSDLRLLGMIGFILEFLLIFIFTKGWRFFWKHIPALNKWIFPDLNGEWEAEIQWTWKGGDDQIKKGTKIGRVVIQQSLLKFSVDLITDESESTTLVVKPFKDPESDQPAFYYMYKSESIDPGNDGGEHKGAAVLKVPLGTLNILSGKYFTSRNTFGRYTFTRKI